MAQNGSQLRASPFARARATTSPYNQSNSNQIQSSGIESPPPTHSVSHTRNQSYSPVTTSTLGKGPVHTRQRSESKISAIKSNTFAPSFIKTDESQERTKVDGIEGENDFSGKRYVWLKDPGSAFVRGWIVEELEGGQILVQCDDGSVRPATISLPSLANAIRSNGRSMARTLTKSTPRNSTKQTTWLS
jgi:myosin protein heavy chain